MIFPTNKIRLVDSYDGKSSSEGWLELNVHAVDIEGAAKLYVNLDDVKLLKDRQSKESDALQQAKKLLGG